MKNSREFLNQIIQQWITLTIVGTLVFVTSISWSWVSDLLFSPPYDYVYTIKKEPNPQIVKEEQIETFMKGLSAELKSIYDENDSKDILSTMKAIPRIMGSMSGEINSNQMRVWIINLRRRPLDNVSFTFQDCTGYVHLEASPLALGSTESTASNPNITSNGAVYRYGTIKPQSNVYVKAGFKNIRDCSATIYAYRSGTELATSQLITPDEWNRYNDTLRPDRVNFVSYLIAGIGGSVGVLLVLLSFVYRSINLRLTKLEKRPSRGR